MNQSHWMPQLRNFWQLVVGVFVSLMGVAWVAYGGTYNFYFNNTEQGENSTANPSVTVGDGKVNGASQNLVGPKPPAAETVAAESAAAAIEAEQPAPTDPKLIPTAAPEGAPGATSVAVIEEPELPRPALKRVRFLIGPALVATKETVDYSYYDTYDGGYDPYSYRSHRSHGGAKIELGLFASRSLAFNFYAGGYDKNGRTQGFGGAELEIQPLHLSVFRMPDLVNFGIMLGASTIGRVRDNWATAHAGARLEFQLGEGLGLAATGRANLGYYMLDAALAIRI